MSFLILTGKEVYSALLGEGVGAVIHNDPAATLPVEGAEAAGDSFLPAWLEAFLDSSALYWIGAIVAWLGCFHLWRELRAEKRKAVTPLAETERRAFEGQLAAAAKAIGELETKVALGNSFISAQRARHEEECKQYKEQIGLMEEALRPPQDIENVIKKLMSERIDLGEGKFWDGTWLLYEASKPNGTSLDREMGRVFSDGYEPEREQHRGIFQRHWEFAQREMLIAPGMSDPKWREAVGTLTPYGARVLEWHGISSQLAPRKS